MEFLQGWLHMDGPFSLLQYSDMLYPQYGEKFGKIIPSGVMLWLRQEAAKKLIEWEWGQAQGEQFYDCDGGGLCKVSLPHQHSYYLAHAHPDVVRHWESLVAGHPPFGYIVKDR